MLNVRFSMFPIKLTVTNLSLIAPVSFRLADLVNFIKSVNCINSKNA